MAISNALVVDDSRLARLTLTRLLEKRQIQVEKATCAREALEALKTSRPDVILMDVTMPDIDGLEATRMITSNPETRSIPVVMCTAEDSEDARAKAEACGATAFLTKPAGDDNLDRVLKEIAERLEAAPLALPPGQAGSAAGLELESAGDGASVLATAAVEPNRVSDWADTVRAAVDTAFGARAKAFEERVLAAAELRANTAASLMVADVANRVASEAAALKMAEQEPPPDFAPLIAAEVRAALKGEELSQRVRSLAANVALAAATEASEQVAPKLAKEIAAACAREVAAPVAREEARLVARKEVQEALYQVDIEALTAAVAKARTTARLALALALVAVVAILAGVAAGFLL